VRATLQELCDKNGFRFVAPPCRLCTDNAVDDRLGRLERMAAGVAGR
jgi:N6-L-threonylcarbamoyladenine synthase